jgi:predicted HAD superfamily Cof-like phosphohydrolase
VQDFFDVERFHIKFGLPCSTEAKPMLKDAYMFRLNFLFEEAEEFSEAYKRRSLVHVVDALLDFNYVVFGTALFIGYPRVMSPWPAYWQIVADLVNNNVQLPTVPTLLEPRMQNNFERSIAEGINGFDRLHIAAEFNERGALVATFYRLRNLASLAYTAAAMMGVPWASCWKHVQNANMAKVRAKADGSDSVRRTPWDVVKPAGWKSPDAGIAYELITSRWEGEDTIMIDDETGRVDLKGEVV